VIVCVLYLLVCAFVVVRCKLLLLPKVTRIVVTTWRERESEVAVLPSGGKSALPPKRPMQKESAITKYMKEL